VFCESFLYLKFGFVIFWEKNIGAKAAFRTKEFCNKNKAINLFITKLNQISPLFNDQSPKNVNNKTI